MRARKPAIMTAALLLAVVISLVPAGSAPMASVGDLLFNGGFEHGFQPIGGCGMVGNGWGCFTNGGTAAYGFYDDMWDPVVFAGEHSQLIEINTKQMGGDADRNAGIYQTVVVHPHAEYELSLKGMIRADDGGGDPWRYRVYVGFDYNGGTNWSAVTDWRELPWDNYYPRTEPGSMSSYSTKVVPTSGRLTVFVRLQRKWGTWYEETDLNVDSISLFGPTGRPPVHPPVKPPEQPSAKPPVAHPPVRPPVQPPAEHPPVQLPEVHPPVKPPVVEVVCEGPNLLMNGGFEHGFQPMGVGNYWKGFTNGGRANFGFYDDTWPPVVAEGSHAQLIEINSKNLPSGTDADRVAGIAQTVFLHPGATYELSLSAMMREEPVAPDEDFYRYMVEWGLSRTGTTDPASMEVRERVPLDKIYPRTEPGAYQSHSTRFVASGGYTTLSIWALKKWATENRELDVDVDNVVLRMCRTKTWHPPVVHPPVYHPPAKPDYPVKDQKPTMPPITRPPSMEKPMEPPAPRTPPAPKPTCDGPGDTWYQVQRGDNMSKLAAQYNTTVQAIVEKNNLSNPNVIYVGQMLCMPGPASAESSDQAAAAPSTASLAPSADVAAAAAAAPAVDAARSGDAAAAPSSSPADSATGPTTYQVQRGDTLSGIAVRHNTNVEALMANNGISNPNFIYVGQTLQVP
jgi:LysM repeat protein